MKNFNLLLMLFCAALLSCSHTAWAQSGEIAGLNVSPHYESFDYPAGDLQGQTPLWWELESSLSSVKSTREVTGSSIVITSGSLNYPNIASVGNKITVPGDFAS